MPVSQKPIIWFRDLNGEEFTDVSLVRAERVPAETPSDPDSYKVYFQIDGIDQQPKWVTKLMYDIIRDAEKHHAAALNAEAEALG